MAITRRGKRLLQAVLAVYRRHQQRVLGGHALLSLGNANYFANDLDAAQQCYEQALAVHRDVRDRIYECEALRGLAQVERDLGRRTSARAHFSEALQAIEQLDERRWRPRTLGHLAILEQEEGALRHAATLFSEAIAEARWVGGRRVAATFRGYFGACLLEQGAVEEARIQLQGAADDLGGAESVALRALFRACISVADALTGDAASAQRELDLSRRELERSPEQLFIQRAIEVHAGHIDVARARAAARAGEATAADQHLQSARARLTVSGVATSDVRFAQRLLQRALGGSIALCKEATWRIHETGLWFEPPHGARIELGRKQALRRLLVRLAQEREQGSTAPLAPGTLIAAGWPGERIQKHAARNRLRVALHTLRRLGLDTLLTTHADGYHLDPQVSIEFVKED